jgi:hypothetical protein
MCEELTTSGYTTKLIDRHAFDTLAYYTSAADERLPGVLEAF